MKKLIALTIALFSLNAFSHCPNEIVLEQGELCFNYTWTNGPHLNGAHGGGHHHMMKNSGRPMASTLEVAFWKHGDSTHAPVQIEGLRIYPWMIMNNGMEHGSRPETLTYDSARGIYIVSDLYFSKMMGYWEVRFAVLDGSDFDPKSDYVQKFEVEFK